jgi:membrane-bound metal-dependent hydrolase YbcI (DUF457 family)
MDWISHLLFGFTLGTVLLKGATREKMAVLFVACLFPDLDILWHHRSGLHSPLILLALALLLAIHYRSYFAPLLIGFWSHSALDIFLFDDSNHTIQNLANHVVSNATMAQHIENNVMHYTAADGIMLLYPVSSKIFSITLNEKSYAIVAGFIIIIAVLASVWLYFKGNPPSVSRSVP